MVFVAEGGEGVAVAAAIGVGALGAGGALVCPVPALEGVGGVEDELSGAAVYPDFIFCDALEEWSEEVVSVGLRGESIREEERDAVELHVFFG